jgi:uncharacterized protein
MTMRLAVNYSLPISGLLRAGQIRLDVLKCPAWPEVIAAARELAPVYVHFPLRVGAGIGDAIDTEKNRPADWALVERLLAETGTPCLNVHMSPILEDYPGISAHAADPAFAERLAENLVRDVRAVAARFGAGRVILENDHAGDGQLIRLALLPELFTRVLAETGCGLLLDVAHARLAADSLELDPRAYLGAFPLERTREVHLCGVQRSETQWAELARLLGVDEDQVRPAVGPLTDHVPLMDADWEFCQWALGQARAGCWGQPDVIAFEYGGVSAQWESVTRTDVLAAQIPRLYELVRGNHAHPDAGQNADLR